jgi:hypothetical protein
VKLGSQPILFISGGYACSPTGLHEPLRSSTRTGRRLGRLGMPMQGSPEVAAVVAGVGVGQGRPAPDLPISVSIGATGSPWVVRRLG